MKPLDVLVWAMSVIDSFLLGVTYVTYQRDYDQNLVVAMIIMSVSLVLGVVYGVIRIRHTRDVTRWEQEERELSRNREMVYRDSLLAAEHRLFGGSVVVFHDEFPTKIVVSSSAMRPLHSGSKHYLLAPGSKVQIKDGSDQLLYEFSTKPGELWSVRAPGNTYSFDEVVFRGESFCVTLDQAPIAEIKAK